MAFYRGPNVVTDGLVLALDAANTKSYPGSGTTWFDISGNNYSGSLTNGPTFSSNNAGYIIFDGVDDYLIRTDSTLKNYTTITANIWMYILSTNSFETYFSYNEVGGTLTQGWGVRRSGTGSTLQYWGGTGNTGIKLYQNGILLSTSSNSNAVVNTTMNNIWQMVTLVATGVSSWNTHNRFTIAIRSDFENFSSVANMRAATFNLHNRELSATEILQNYNAQKSRFGL